MVIDKNPGITCAVNKINTIDSAFRNFQMEVLAGEEDNMTTKVCVVVIISSYSKKRVKSSTLRKSTKSEAQTSWKDTVQHLNPDFLSELWTWQALYVPI